MLLWLGLGGGGLGFGEGGDAGEGRWGIIKSDMRGMGKGECELRRGQCSSGDYEWFLDGPCPYCSNLGSCDRTALCYHEYMLAYCRDIKSRNIVPMRNVDSTTETSPSDHSDTPAAP